MQDQTLGQQIGIADDTKYPQALTMAGSSNEDMRTSIIGLIKRTNARNACVTAFLPDSEPLCFYDGIYNPEYEKAAIDLAEKMRGVSLGPLDWPEFSRYVDEEKQKTLGLDSPSYFPLIMGAAPYGALWCDYPEDESEAQICKSSLLHICEALCVLFYDRIHSNHIVDNKDVLSRLLENLNANIYVSDLETDEIYFINKKMRLEFGLDSDFSGQKCWEVLQKGQTERCSYCPIPRLESNPRDPVSWESKNSMTGKFYKNTDSIIFWTDGKPAHLQYAVDITAEKTIQQSLLDAKKESDLASQAKSDFLSRMSHEIRTPLNAIIGMTRIASGVNELSKMKECIRKINTSSEQLLALINDILDMSKIEANKMEIACESFDFEKMLINISNVISVKSEEKQQKLHVHMDIDMPRFYNGDELRISQVLTNLLSNAVKFTPNGGTVRMKAIEKTRLDEFSTIEITVEDSGIGIPSKQLPMLFTAFEQADGGIARRFGGTGLGLAISKNIVSMMGGSINVESTPGKGSVFTVTINLKRDESAVSPKMCIKGIDLRSLRTAILSPSTETRDYFIKIMESFKIKADSISSLDCLLEKLDKSVKDKDPYQIVFVDWDIENTYGPTLCKMIKERYGSCVIVLISASQLGEVSEEAQSSGVFKYLQKPFFPSILFNVISEAVGISKNQVERSQRTRYFFAGYKIMVAEDVEINREVIAMALEDTKVKIDFVENGKEAVDKFSANPDNYDLILMDVNMPVMDGYDATRTIRSLPIICAPKIPILAMTANAFAEDIQKSIDCGMNDHLSKPVDFKQLFTKLQKYLIEYKMPLKDEVLNKMPDNATPAASHDGLPEIPGLSEYIDLQDGLKRIRGNRKIYKTLLQSFLKNSHIEELKSEIENNDFDAASKTAHAIKGASANLSLIAVNKSSIDLESQFKAGTFNQATLETCLDNFEKTKGFIEDLMQTL